MELKPVYLEARDIPDAWFRLIYALVDGAGFSYGIDQGSFQNEFKRLEFDWVTVYIKFPHGECRPVLNPALGLSDPIPPDFDIGSYAADYILTGNKKPDEAYTYGQRLSNYNLNAGSFDQILYWVDKLKKAPRTNQAIMTIAVPEDGLLEDPPCLRHIDMRIREGVLIFYPYFRSWDLWSGFPANLGGISILQQFMAEEIGVEAGPMICSSKGLHLYSYVWEFSAQIRGRNVGEFLKEVAA